MSASERHLIQQSSLGRGDSRASLPELEEESLRDGPEPWRTPTRTTLSKPVALDFSHEKRGEVHLEELAGALQTVTMALRQVAEAKVRAEEGAELWRRQYEAQLDRAVKAEERLLALEVERLKLDKAAEGVSLPETSQGNLANGSLPPGQTAGPKGLPPAGARTDLSPPPIDRLCGSRLISTGTRPAAVAAAVSAAVSAAVDGSLSSTLRRPRSSREWEFGIGEGLEVAPTCKSSFRLAWGPSVAEQERRHKHDIVSFEHGDIRTMVRGSKQITLLWDFSPQTICIVTKPKAPAAKNLCIDMARWLIHEKGLNVVLDPQMRQEIVEECRDLEVLRTWKDSQQLRGLHEKVDLVITLGGDGTVLWAASLFNGPVPPMLSFAMGSLGFMTPFQGGRFKEVLDSSFEGPLYLTLRHRIQCCIVRRGGGAPSPDGQPGPNLDKMVLNEVAIDRGMSSFLANLECYCDDVFVTSVQGDGLILSTPSGSTAYSLAAGGSMVHPQVPGILFTPICPHSLSFRPLILPEYVTLRIQVPQNARGQAWVSFDGKDRQQLSFGDALLLRMSQWPVPAACESDSTKDFLRGVHEGLHWNLRKPQA